MKRLIAILPKSPWPNGRFGPTSWQDWYHQCMVAVSAAQPGDELVVSSANFFPLMMNCPEEWYYVSVVERQGMPLTTLGKGVETITHLEALARYAQMRQAELYLVVTWSHVLRVVYLLKRRSIRAKLLVASGLPRPRELATDAVCTLVYPLVDSFGYGPVFEAHVVARRSEGKF